MDIKLPINLLPSLALNSGADNTLTLKLGQKLDVTVISALIKSETNTIALKLGDNTFTAQSNQPIKLMPGQSLQIQVTKIVPVLEFAIIVSSPELKSQAPTPDLRLKLITPSSGTPKIEPSEESILPAKQPLAAKIIALTDSKLKLQVFTDTELAKKPQTIATSGFSKPSVTITIDRSQLLTAKITSDSSSAADSKTLQTISAPVELKAGQTVILEIRSKGTTPTYKIAFPPPPTTEEKVTEFIKQLLPRHEASPVLLNQLIKELPQLLKTSSVPEALKHIAARLLQNLPPRQLLNDSSGLKQAIVNSGLFLEAKIAELKGGPEVTIDQDFKANLLKLVDVIKGEVVKTELSEPQNQDIDSLKNLQQKTENSIAKTILDQLTSLPKEDSPKQLWMIDIPFIDRGKADTVSLQITKDQKNNQSSENDKDKWSVTLTMNPPGLGSIQCQLTYQDDTINAYFRSQQTQTAELISDHTDHLKCQFEDAGLKPGVINIQQGFQPAKPVYQIAGTTLLDEQV
jgi:hypothetical protein